MNDSIDVWLAILGITAATFVARSSLLVLGHRVTIPPTWQAALRFAPACALAAIAFPDLVFTPQGLDLGINNPRWLAGLAGIAIFVIFRSTIATIFGGMTVFWLLKWGLGL